MKNDVPAVHVAAKHLGPADLSAADDDGCPDAVITSVLFQRLNLSYPGLEAAKVAVASGDHASACKVVATYYSEAKSASWLRHPSPPPGTALAGGEVDEVMVNDTYDFYGEIGRVPRNSDGGLDWFFRGPVDDDVRREPTSVLVSDVRVTCKGMSVCVAGV